MKSNHRFITNSGTIFDTRWVERLFGSVVDAGCIIRILVSKIVWKIDFIEIISSSIGHRIRPRSCWHVAVLFFVVTINLKLKFLEIWWPIKAIIGSWRERRVRCRSCSGLIKIRTFETNCITDSVILDSNVLCSTGNCNLSIKLMSNNEYTSKFHHICKTKNKMNFSYIRKLMFDLPYYREEASGICWHFCGVFLLMEV